MGLRTTLVLLLAVGGLGSLLLLTDEKPASNKTVESPALDGRQVEDCARLRWQFHNQPVLEVARDPQTGFWIREPLVDLASIAHLRQMFTSWDSAQLQATQFADDAKGRMETGLLEPELVLWFEWPDGKKLQIDVGAPGPIGSDRFLRREGRIYRGGSGLYESMRVGIDDLRERAVFRIMEPQCSELAVEQIQATGKREKVRVKRVGAEWRLVEPIQGRANQAKTIEFVTAVLSLRADHFLPGAVRFPEREADIVVVAKGAFGEETARLWEMQGSVFGSMPGRGVAFDSDNRQYAQKFQNASVELRSTILLPETSLAQTLGEALVDPGQGRGDRVRLLRSGEAAEWRLVEPVAYHAGATPVAEFLSALNSLQAVEFVDGADANDPRFGLGAGRLQVSVRELDKKALTTLWLGGEVTRNGLPLVYACRADEPGTVVLVPKPAVDQLRRAWPAYCQLDVVKQTAAIGRLVLHRGNTVRTFRTREGHWILDGAEGNRDEVGGFANDELRDLRGKAAVSMRPGSPFGAPDWTLDLCREDGDVLITLQVWDRGKDEPMVVRPVSPVGNPGDVGFELAPQVGKALRDFWQ